MRAFRLALLSLAFPASVIAEAASPAATAASGEVAPAAAASTSVASTDRAPAATKSAAPLTLEQVLAGVRERYPVVLAAEKDREAAKAEVQAAEGAFDILWRTRATSAFEGFYQNERVDSLIEQPTTLWGTTLFGGYRLGTGKFAVYDGKLETNPGGELRAGLAVPLWRDGPTDRRRTNLAKAKLGTEAADLAASQQRILALRSGAHRYWDWVAAGHRTKVFRDLLRIAEERDAGLAARVRHGDLPVFERRDNERAILQRRSQLIAAERLFQQTGFELSLFVRDADGRPVVPAAEQLPPSLPVPDPLPPHADEAAALEKRPDLRRITPLRKQNVLERDLAANQAAPRVDVQLQGVQSLRQGDPTRNEAQLEASVVLEIPLQRNVARGREAVAVATEERLAVEERFLRERIVAEVRDAHSALEASRQRVEVTAGELALSRRLEEDERTRFRNGDSNQLFVNLREQATADAAVREIEALADYQKAVATLRAATAAD